MSICATRKKEDFSFSLSHSGSNHTEVYSNEKVRESLSPSRSTCEMHIRGISPQFLTVGPELDLDDVPI